MLFEENVVSFVRIHVLHTVQLFQPNNWLIWSSLSHTIQILSTFFLLLPLRHMTVLIWALAQQVRKEKQNREYNLHYICRRYNVEGAVKDNVSKSYIWNIKFFLLSKYVILRSSLYFKLCPCLVLFYGCRVVY